MNTFATLTEENPNIRQQYDDWRQQRTEKGEDPTDWDAFREFVMYIGAPDPGMRPPDDFVGDDFREQNPDWVARYHERESSV